MANHRLNGTRYFQNSQHTWQNEQTGKVFSSQAMEIMKRFPNGYTPTENIHLWDTSEIWVASEYPTDSSVSYADRTKPEVMGNVNKFQYVKPMVRFNNCAAGGGLEQDYPPLSNSGATAMINSNCFYPSPNGRLTAIKDRLMELPAGKRCLYTIRYNNAMMFDESISTAGATYWDKFSNGATGSLWAENIGLTYQNDARILFSKLKDFGAEMDYVIFDMEQIAYLSAKYSGTDANALFDSRVNGITLSTQYTQTFYGSPSFQSIISEYPQFNFNDILNGVSNTLTNPSYTYWNRALFSVFSSWINNFLVKPIQTIYPNVKISNFEMFNGSTLNYYYDPGFHENKPLGIVGDGPSPSLYSGNQANVQDFGILQSDPTRIVLTGTPGFTTVAGFDGSAWNHFFISVQNMRSVKRENYNYPIRPWIENLFFTNNNQVWNVNATNRGLYYEMIRHVALTGTEVFLYSSGEDVDNTYTEKLNNVIMEINQQIGGYRNNALVTSKLSFLDQFVISGTQCGHSTYKWRVTPKPGTNIYYNNKQVFIDSDGGSWITTTTPTKPVITNIDNIPI